MFSLFYGLYVLPVVFLILLYLTRAYWVPQLSFNFNLPFNIPFIYTPVPSTPSTFQDDAAAGLHSTTFDLSGNIEGGDGRRGLDERAKREVQRVMKSRNVGFDEARRIVVNERFRKEGIGPDGRPRDPKFVSFS